MEIIILSKRSLFSSILFLFVHFVSSHQKVKIAENDIECSKCKEVVEAVDYFQNSKNTDDLLEFIRKKCVSNPSKICTVGTKKDLNALLALITINVTSESICNFYSYDICNKDQKDLDWKVTFPVGSIKSSNRAIVAPVNVKRKLKILHLSDPFYDLFRPKDLVLEEGLSKDNLLTIERAFKHIAKTHKDIDFIFWTEDIPPSNVWNLRNGSSVEYLLSTLLNLNKYFNKAQIYPAVGNYQGFLIDRILKKKNGNMSKLYRFLLSEWIHIIKNDVNGRWKKHESTLRGGYYNVSARPGLRIISLNGNHCSRYNSFFIKNNSKPKEQLDSLIKVLEDAKKSHEKVFILSSMLPSDPNCAETTWFKRYHEIINRYEAIIVAQFYGTSPNGEKIAIFYDNVDYERPVSLGYFGQSLMPSSEKNPSYRVYYVDGHDPNPTYEIVDAETYVLDPEKGVWNKYEDREEYNITSFLPIDWKSVKNQESDYENK